MACYKFQRWRFRTNSYGTNGRFRRNIISDGGFARYEGICPPSNSNEEEETNIKSRCHVIFVFAKDSEAALSMLPAHLQNAQVVYRLENSAGNVLVDLYVFVWYGPLQPSGWGLSGDAMIFQDIDPNLPPYANSIVNAIPTYYWEPIGNISPQCAHLASIFNN